MKLVKGIGRGAFSGKSQPLCILLWTNGMFTTLSDIESLLKTHYATKILAGSCYVDTLNWRAYRNDSAPLWVNGVVGNDVLACDIGNFPIRERNFLMVSFFWRVPLKSYNTAGAEEATSCAYWHSQNKPFPKGYFPVMVGNGCRLLKVYNKNFDSAREIVREITDVYSLFGV